VLLRFEKKRTRLDRFFFLLSLWGDSADRTQHSQLFWGTDKSFLTHLPASKKHMPAKEASTESKSKSERAGLIIPVPRVGRISAGVIGKKTKTRTGGKYAIMMAAASEEVLRSLVAAMEKTGHKQYGVRTVKQVIRQDPELKKLFGNVAL
jgi:hypothetical protein